jgi:hypothetical protein
VTSAHPTAENVEWTTSTAEVGFGPWTDDDEFLHGTGPEGDSLTETWFWGFNIPRHAINCYLYCWVHPNLDVVSAGVIIYRRITPHHLCSELVDFPAYLKASAVVGDGSRIAVPNGLTITVLEPMRHILLEYRDTLRDTLFNVHLRALSEPIMRSNGLHFEQIMHAEGELVLRGERFPVDGHVVRDRSWGELRPEAHNPGPPYNWVTAVAEDGTFAFNLGSIDDPVAQAAENFRDGWLWRDGVAARLQPRPKTVAREGVLGRPARYEADVLDLRGRSLAAHGEVVASVPWSGWHNMMAHLGLVRWSTADATAWGETQDCQWNDQMRTRIHEWLNSTTTK